MTKTQMAEKLGVSSQLLGQYEHGKHKPKIEFYNKWKEIFNEELQNNKVSKVNYSEAEIENNVLTEEDKPLVGKMDALIRIIEKQQETIHFLTTGNSQSDGLKKNVSR